MTGRTCGLYSSENAGMSSENCVRIVMAENLRFPDDGETASEIIESADKRLYQSKHNGRNQVN